VSAVAHDPPRIDLDLAREAFDRTAIGLAVITPEGIFRQVNRAFCAITGYSREELEGRSYVTITHPGRLARDEASLKALATTSAEPAPLEKRYLRKGGGEVWVRRSVAVVRDAGGEPRYLVGAFIDLTEQRGKDRALNQVNAFLQAIVETSPIAIYTTDRAGVVTFWNRAAERTFGHTREEAVGRPAPFVPESERESTRGLRERVLSGEVLDGLQVERTRADGTPIVIRGSAAPLRDAEDRIVGLLVACVDVTEARRTSQELERHLHFTRALIDAIPNPVYFKDREGRYLVHNRAWGELFGGGENWIGKTVFDMYETAIAQAHDERDRALLERPSRPRTSSSCPRRWARRARCSTTR
jgi:PAS domain S-box